MSEQPFAQADAEWLELTRAAREWLASPLGELLLNEERQALDEELARYFGGYLVHYGPAEAEPSEERSRYLDTKRDKMGHMLPKP